MVLSSGSISHGLDSALDSTREPAQPTMAPMAHFMNSTCNRLAASRVGVITSCSMTMARMAPIASTSMASPTRICRSSRSRLSCRTIGVITVGPPMADSEPSKRDSGQSMPVSTCAAQPPPAVVISGPNNTRRPTIQPCSRRARKFIFRPPSKRIMARPSSMSTYSAPDIVSTWIRCRPNGPRAMPASSQSTMGGRRMCVLAICVQTATRTASANTAVALVASIMPWFLADAWEQVAALADCRQETGTRLLTTSIQGMRP